MLDFFSLLIIIIVDIIAGIIILYTAHKAEKSKSLRFRMLWRLILTNGFVFLIGLLLIIIFAPQAHSTLVSWLVYDLIISFTFSLEIPGWIRLSKLDESHGKIFNNIRTALIKTRFDFDENFSVLKKTVAEAKEVLEDEGIGEIMDDFINACEDYDEPLNENLWSLTLSETTERIDFINKRSKHPIPKLIDILALSGLSVLIAELLKLIG